MGPRSSGPAVTPTEREGWGHEQVRVIRLLRPHLRQAARVRRAMADARALGASLAGLLENRRLGLIQLDRRGRILEANDRARDMLLKRDGLRDDGGVLTSGHAGENEELQRLLAKALPRYGVQGAGGSMKITRRKDRTPLVLEIHPVRGMGVDCRARQVGALVLVVDPARRSRGRSGPGGQAPGIVAQGEPRGGGGRGRPDGRWRCERAGLRGIHCENAPQADSPQARHSQADRTRAEDPVAGKHARVLPLTGIPRGIPTAFPWQCRSSRRAANGVSPKEGIPVRNPRPMMSFVHPVTDRPWSEAGWWRQRSRPEQPASDVRPLRRRRKTR